MNRWPVRFSGSVALVALLGFTAGGASADERAADAAPSVPAVQSVPATRVVVKGAAAGEGAAAEVCEAEKKPAAKKSSNPLQSFISGVFNAVRGTDDDEDELEFMTDEDGIELPGLVVEGDEGESEPAPEVTRRNSRVAERATHKQSHDVVLRGLSYKTLTLKTFCLSPEGHIVGALGPAENYGLGGKPSKRHVGEIQIVAADGQKIRDWTIAFEPQAINCSSDGTIFVAGDGKLAKYTSEGQEISLVDAPHLAALLGDPDRLREQAEAQLKAEKESFTTVLEDFEGQLREAEEKDPAERTKSEKRRISQLKSMVTSYRMMVKQVEQRTVESVVEELATRQRTINSLAVSDEDVFYTCNETKGYGYAAWRTTRDFTEPKQIVSGLSGCCGQMDMQCCDGELVVAENSRHRVLRYNREGKQLASFGNKGQPAGAGFGGCCNPMNLRVTATGDLLTAESEGYVKRFTPEGKFVELVGVAKVSGGCKNVAVAASTDGRNLFFYDQQGSKVVVLEQKPVPVSVDAEVKATDGSSD